MNKKREKIICLLFIVAFLIPIIQLDYPEARENISPELSTNYLFKDVVYNMTLEDVYDDEDSYKTYTNAYFQSDFFNATNEWDSISNETVDSGVDNNEIELGDPANINMITGTSGEEDEMTSLDAVCTTFTSTALGGTSYESPAQFGDFNFTKGSGNTVGELLTDNDVNYAIIDSELELSGESLLGTMDPADSDILTGWTGALPHWSRLDEGVGGCPDTNIISATTGVNDKWNFDNGLTIPVGRVVTKLVFYGCCDELGTSSTGTIDITTSVGASGSWAVPVDWGWISDTVSDLNFGQAELDAFWMNIYADMGSSGLITLECVYVAVYTSLAEYSVDYIMTWDVPDVNLCSIDNLLYDYRTTVAVDCDLDIFNYDTETWLQLESNTKSTFDTGSYALTDPYINASDYVKIRFQTAGSSSDFDMELDQITLRYYTEPSELEFTILTPFDNYNMDLLSIHVESHQKGSVSETIDFEIWDDISEEYDTISSSSETSITKKEFNSVDADRYISSDGVELRWSGERDISTFVFSIDYLLIRICYTMDLWHEASFDTLGLWRYRWEIHGSLEYTDWTSFEVVDPIPNFHAISESDVTTRWILQGADISPVEDFHDDINTNYWNLVDVLPTMTLMQTIIADTHVMSGLPDTNYGSNLNLFLENEHSYGIAYTYIKANDISYLTSNITSDAYLKVYVIDSYNTPDVMVYFSNPFSEYSTTWNNKPDTISYIDTTTLSNDVNIWQSINLGMDWSINYYQLNSSTIDDYLNTQSRHNTNKPYIYYEINKNYFGSGYMYMQTNTTETIALKSTDYGTHYTLSSGDYFEVDFQTNSDSQINLILLKDGVVQKTLTLSQSGNTNFNRHTAQISVSESLEFDQLKISSTFEDTDYVKVYDIKTYKYTLTGDYEDFYVSPNNQRDVYLTPDDYNLKIYERIGIDSYEIRENFNLTIPTTDHYVFIPQERIQCRLTLYSIAEPTIPLIFENYHILVNRSYNGEYNQFSLVEPLFFADVGTYVYIDVKDRFDNLIDSFSPLASSYIDLDIEVYQLQIKSLMELQTTVYINTTHTYPLLPQESLYFMLSASYYLIEYTDDDGDDRSFLINLDSNQAFVLNRSQICFLSYTDQSGNHLYFEDYKTYINGTLLYENVFYEDAGDIVSINITDRYDISIYSGTYTVLSSNNYIPIIMDIYELKLKNMQDEFNNINITRAPYPISGDMGDIVETGNYPATYSFEDDIVGGNPSGWVIGETGGTVNVISELDGHKKVLELDDTGVNTVDIIQTFTDGVQIDGTVEFWFRSNDVTDPLSIFIRDASNNAIVSLAILTDKIQYYYTAGYHDATGGGVIDNKWYHIKIFFDITPDTYDFYLNGVLLDADIPFRTVETTGLANIRMVTSSASANYKYYFDAIGYSWDSEYNIGDNLNDYYYLGSEPFENYNQTTEGDYYGSESFDYNTEEGVYYGTYDFRDDANGVLPSGWTDNGIVYAEIDNHLKVIGVHGVAQYTSQAFSARDVGTLEYWFYTTDATPRTNIYMYGGEGSQFAVRVTGELFHYTNDVPVDTTWECLDNTWYHIKYVWRADDTADVWCNGIKEVDNDSFQVTGTDFYKIELRTYDTQYSYLDAVGYLWDTTSHGGLGYDESWNINPYDLEILLDSFIHTNYFDLGWESSVSVIPLLDGHNNVLNFTKGTSSSISQFYYEEYGYGKVNGAFEFWWQSNSITESLRFGLLGHSWNEAPTLKLSEDGYIRAKDGASYVDVVGITTDAWYHIKFTFECDVGLYDGLLADTYNVYINGTQYGPYDFTTAESHLDYTRFYSYSTDTLVEHYFDALGFSWDSNYDIGDNINSHGKAVITELENEGWTIINEPYSDIGISGGFDFHKKFLNMTDDSSYTYWAIDQDFSPVISGTVEFYYYITTDQVITFYLRDAGGSSSVRGYIRHSGNNFKVYDAGVLTTIKTPDANNEWHHIRIDFECGAGGYMGLSADTFDLYIDGVLEADDFDFINGDLASITEIMFTSTDQYSVDVEFYIDAIGYSWDSQYYTGDNYNYYDVESEYSWTTNIAPDEIVSFRLLKGFYNIWMINSNETIAFSFRLFDDNYFILNRSQLCFLSYQDVSGDYLNFRDYITNINDSVIYDNYFYGNIGEIVNITVQDFYNTTLATQIYTILSGNNYIPLTLNVYELKIKNEALDLVYYSLENNDTAVIRTGYIFPEEIITFSIALGDYSLDYINYEDSFPREYNFALSDHRTITINTTYHTVYFGLFTYDGLGLNRDWIRFYINNERRDFGLNIIQSETANLLVLDYFNNTLANETIDASVYSEYNLYVQVYSMYILNQFTYLDLVFNITQVGSGYYMNQLIPSASALLYRFIPNVNYTINCTYVNGTVYSIRTINLTENSQIVSFGIASAPEEYPKDVYFGIYSTTGLGIDHNLLRFYIDGNRTDFGFNRIEDMIILLTVKDYFNSTLFNEYVNTSGIYEYNILITLYSVKIKNEAKLYSNFTLKLGSLETIGFILPEEIIEYQLASNNYVFEYTNNEDNSFHTININLNQDRVYILNSTYYNIYFSLYDVNLHIFSPSQYEFRLNNTIYDFGFVEDLQSDDYTITITDRFGVSLFNSIITLRGLNEYRIDVSLYELQISHLAEVNSDLTLSETTTHSSLDFSMSPDSLRSFILGSSTYNVSWTNGENGVIIGYDINLNTDYILTLNSTYYNIYFTLFDLNLHSIDPSLYEFRLNNTIYDFGFVEDLQSDDYTITVTDRFGISLFNSIITLRGLNEYRIDVSLYELQISHLAEVNSNLTLSETTTHNSFNFSMAPDTIISFLLGNSTYNVTWVNGENGDTILYDITLDENFILTLNTTFYTIYFSLYDQNGVRLDDSLFSLYLNSTRKDFGTVLLETNSTLILVQDFLNVTVFNSAVSLRGLNEYNIIITVFELQIRHLAQVNSNITLFETTTHNHINFSMSPNSLNKYMLSDSIYNITWINGENLQTSFYEFNLSSNYILTLPTTYFDVYFSLFNFDGLGLEPYLFRFYINGLRKDLGFNTLKSDTNTLKVLDYFNQTLFNRAINLQGFTEYSIYIEVWTMILYNNYSFPVKIKIERNDIEVEQIIEAGISFPYRMLPKVEYFIKVYHLNGTLLETRDTELDENNKVVSFGFYEEEVLDYPSFDNTTITIVLIILIFIGVISLITYFVYKYGKRVQNLKVAYARQHTIEKDLIEGVSGHSSRIKKIK